MPDQDNMPDPDHFAAANAMLGGDASPPTHPDPETAKTLGADPAAWARAFSNTLGGPPLSAMARDRTEVEVMTPWFNAAIEAGRKAGYALARPLDPGTVHIGSEPLELTEDHRLALVDTLAGGIGVMQDGKRVAPEDFYRQPNQYRKKPVVIEAITFDQLVTHGIASGAALNNGVPWSFEYKGHPITHENDDCYLIPTLEGTMRFERGAMLITGVKGEIYPCAADIFAATYDPVTDE